MIVDLDVLASILILTTPPPSDFFKLVLGMKPVDPADLAEYERAMREEVIPELLKQQNDRYWGVSNTTSEAPVARLG